MSGDDKRKSILHCIHNYKRANRPSKQSTKADGSRNGVLPADTTDHSQKDKALTTAISSPTSAQASSASSVKARNFYGSNRLLLIDQRVARLCANAQRRLHCKQNAPFERFSLQRQAFAWAEAHELAADLKTFSVEHDATGKRSFLVSTYEGFWQRYRDMLPDHRHYYEIIQESHPCHLYFDLEYHKAHNDELNGEGLVDTLLAIVANQLKALFAIDFDPAWVVELESEAQHKFSRHLIIPIPSMAFANNLHVGSFVSKLCKAAKDPLSGNSSLQVAKDGGTTVIVDTGVYTRNRAFRLYLSSKAGKDSILTPTRRFQNKSLSQKQIFMQSLICKVQPGTKLLECFDEGKPHQANGRRCSSAPHLGNAVNSQANIGPSPCPSLDHFVSCICNQGGVQGSVRSWIIWDDIGVILYNIKDNRWCGNIERAHKSNGIYIIADLQAGVWIQRCYDPECRDYRSSSMPLPLAVVRECAWVINPAPSHKSSNAGVLNNIAVSDEAAMLAALEDYESVALHGT